MNTKTKQYIVAGVAIWALLGSLFVGFRNSSADATTTCVNDSWTATLNGTVETSDPNTQAWFQWGESPSVPYPTPVQIFNYSSNFSEVLTELKENTTYYFQVVVQNEYLSDRGEIKSFHTGTCSTPPPQSTTQCSDGKDNDGDGKIDMADPFCTDPGDDDEREPVSNPAPTPNPSPAPGNTQAGNLSAQCLYNPFRIQLNWTSGQNANSNGLQKADVEPGNSNRYWGWLPTNDSQRSYTDYNVTQGNTYTYRVKYSPSVPSNEVTPNCGTTPPPPQTCQDPNATNFGGTLPCQYNQNQPNVNITADDPSIDEDESTTVRWTSTNATSCSGSSGRNGWSGSKDTGNNRSFFTGSLPSDTTYTITCYNNAGVSSTDSVTVRVNSNNNDEGPDVTTRSATDVDSNSATLNGRVDGNGSDVDAWFEYGTSRNNLNRETRVRNYDSGSTSYDADISGLQANTTYYFRAIAENDEEQVEGQILSFYTGDDYTYYPPTPTRQPTVNLTADRTSISYNQGTTVRWYSINATSCYASGGSLGWAGVRNVGSGSFYAGNLTSSKTFSITCTGPGGTATDSVTIIVGQVQGTTTYRPTGNALILLSTEVDRHQAIVPSLDNTRPHPGDEINYTLKYQNVGNATATNLVLRLDLPYEVDYMYSTPSNPTRNGQTLIWSLGSLRAGASGQVAVRVRLRNDAPAGTLLNFPATLTYNDPSGYPQSVSANISATVWGDSNTINTEYNGTNSRVLGASVIGSGFFPGSLFEWLLLLILILVLIVLIKYIFNQSGRHTTVVAHH